MKGSRFSHAVIAKIKWRALTYDTCGRYAQWLVLCHACTADFTAGRTARGLFVLILVNAGVIPLEVFRPQRYTRNDWQSLFNHAQVRT